MTRSLAALVLVISIVSCKKTPPPQPEALTLAPFVRALPPLKSGEAPSDASMTIIVTKTNIAFGTLLVAPLPPQDSWSSGIDAKYKRTGKNDLYIVPLANIVSEKNDADGGKKKIDATILCDGDVPFRILVEVLFTLGQNKVTEFHFVGPSAVATASKDTLAQIDMRPPHAPTRLKTLEAPPVDLSLLVGLDAAVPRPTKEETLPEESVGLRPAVILVKEGFSVKASGGNVAPGCTGAGAGVAIANAADGARDFKALAACLAKLKAAQPDFAKERAITIAASPDATYRDFLATADAVRGDRADLFPDVLVGIAR